MSKIKIRYVLSEAGQKASLLAGGDGRQVQEIDCPDDVLPQALPLASITADGTGVVSIGGWSPKRDGGQIVGVYIGASRPTTGYRIEEGADSYLVTGWGRENRRFSHPVVRIVEQSGDGVLLYATPAEPAQLVSDESERRQRLSAAKAAVEAEIEPLQTEAAAKKAEAKAAHDAAQEEENRLRQQDNDEDEKRKSGMEAETKRKRSATMAWIREHGSERLRTILDAKLIDGSLRLYNDERLEIERPGWVYNSDWLDGGVEHRDIRNPSMAALIALRKAKAAGIEAELVWAHYGTRDEYYEDGEIIREPILTAVFLGRTIVLRLGDDAD